MQERRQHKRLALDQEVEIRGKIALANYVRVLNMSTGGISFEADKRLNIDREYTLEIVCSRHVLHVKGIVVWSLISESKRDNKGNVIPIYRAGMKFTNVSGDQTEEFINHIAEQLKLKSDEHIQQQEFIDLSEHFKEALDLFANK
jgi:c-di-GMP-binding flagellar brake protein YcgR